MAVYLFTFHAYRSWMPDHRRGFVQRRRGIRKPNAEMAASYRRRANFDRVRFSDDDCQPLLNEAWRVCRIPARAEAGWRLHIGVAVFNHPHLLVSWRGFFSAKRARAVLHRALSVKMRSTRQTLRRPYLSRGGSIKRVQTRKHFDHLLNTYLPSHRKYDCAMLIPS